MGSKYYRIEVKKNPEQIIELKNNDTRKINILTGIPVITNDGWLTRTLLSLNNKRTLIVDNNSNNQCKDVIKAFKCKTIVNTENNYVNPAWNQIMKFFLKNKKYTHLNILNSDICLVKGWEDFLSKNWVDNVLPIVSEVKEFTGYSGNKFIQVDGGHPGICILLTRKQVECVYPIPEEIRIWFGDNYIWNKLKNKMNCVQGVYIGLEAIHGNSRSVSCTEGVYDIIEEDKIAWKKDGYKWTH